MIVVDDQIRSEVMSSSQVESMSIKANSKSIMVMVDRLYSRKKEAVVRELGANALDAHRIIGNPDPYTIIMPSELDPNITFIDYGPGLSWEDTKRYLGTLFESSKDGENVSIGHYGLGSKSPHTVSSSYVIESRWGGKLTKSIWFRDGDDMPKFMQVSVEDYEGPTGITFKIPCEEDDHQSWVNAIATQTAGMTPKPKVISLGVEMTDIYDHTLIESFGPIDMVESDNLRRFFGPTIINMGGILYPARGISDLVDVDIPIYNDIVHIINVPIGACLPPPHRESLEDCKHTQDGINQAIKESNAEWKLALQHDCPKPYIRDLSFKEARKATEKYLLSCWDHASKYKQEIALYMMREYTVLDTELRSMVEEYNEKLEYFRVTITGKTEVDRRYFGHSMCLVPKEILFEEVKKCLHLGEVYTRVAKERGAITAVVAKYGMVHNGDFTCSSRNHPHPYYDLTFGKDYQDNVDYSEVNCYTQDMEDSCNVTYSSAHDGRRSHRHGGSVFLNNSGLNLISKSESFTPNQRRWIHARVVQGEEANLQNMTKYDLKKIDQELREIKGIIRLVHRHKRVPDEIEQARIEGIESEFRQVMKDFSVELEEVPNQVKLDRPRAASLNLTGVRLMRREQIQKQNRENLQEVFTQTPAWVPVPTIHSFEVKKPKDCELEHRHAYVYSAEDEVNVYLDRARTVKVPKAWVVGILSWFEDIYAHEYADAPRIELIRLGKNDKVRDAIEGLKAGKSKEISLLEAWRKAENGETASMNPIAIHWGYEFNVSSKTDILLGKHRGNDMFNCYTRRVEKPYPYIRNALDFIKKKRIPIMTDNPQARLNALVLANFGHMFADFMRSMPFNSLTIVRKGGLPKVDFVIPEKLAIQYVKEWRPAVNKAVNLVTLHGVEPTGRGANSAIEEASEFCLKALAKNPDYVALVLKQLEADETA